MSGGRAPGPQGVLTRGTTAAGRLRRVDRWLTATHPHLLDRPDLLVVDLGFGARPVTTFELAARVRARNPVARVVGLDIDPVRVADARAITARTTTVTGVDFAVGGFELAGLQPHVLRTMNVLRQYSEAAAATAWRQLAAGIAPDGVVVEGTCDESGRLGSWVTLDQGGPRALTLAVTPDGPPSAVAARLPKALISRNVAGEPIFTLLAELDEAWRRHAPLSVFGHRQRLATAVADLRSAGWPILDGPARWRRGELSVSWGAVRPSDR